MRKMTMFEAVILAGGKGTRLSSVSRGLPKPMVDVGGEPFLYKLMKRLESRGCARIVLSLGYKADYVVRRIEADKPVDCEICFSIEDTPLGTGGAIKKSMSLVRAERFLVLNGDTYCDINYDSLFKYSQDYDLVLSGVKVLDSGRYGMLTLDDANNVLSINEKGASREGVINSGIYVVSKKDMLNFDRDVFSFEEDFLKTFKGSFKCFQSNGYFIDIGIPEDYYKACDTIR
jgi:D-glycero-alpha-D-manno-heptose 1-phosphate guanylyltransferase